MSETVEMPASIDLPKVKLPKRRLVLGVAAPVAVMGLLCTIDVQTMGQQKPAECKSTQQAVTVPKPHIWLAGAITGLMDEPTALRDVMARTRPDVALTQVVAANPTIALAPMGDVPPTYGGRACLDLPTNGAAKGKGHASASQD